jgi:SAM-dependent methyltransferase
MNSSADSSQTSPAQHSLRSAAARWWKDAAARDGAAKASWQLLVLLWEFARDSMPERLRSRFGDAEYDWEHHVNTTSGAVNWRDRLLGMFHSPYQPTEPVLFHEMLQAVETLARVNVTDFTFRDFTFIDLGSGKGRTLLMAADYPFRRVVGVELLSSLHAIALENLAQYRAESQQCFSLDAVCDDASEFHFSAGPIVLYLFNPLPEAGLRRALANLERSLREQPRAVYVLYHNPQLEFVLRESAALRRIGGTHQYAIYAAMSG